MDMRRGPKTDALKEQINKYRPQLPQYDAITWLGIGLAIGANMLIAVRPRKIYTFKSAYVHASPYKQHVYRLRFLDEVDDPAGISEHSKARAQQKRSTRGQTTALPQNSSVAFWYGCECGGRSRKSRCIRLRGSVCGDTHRSSGRDRLMHNRNICIEGAVYANAQSRDPACNSWCGAHCVCQRQRKGDVCACVRARVYSVCIYTRTQAHARTYTHTHTHTHKN
jgi:hypothetical protein